MAVMSVKIAWDAAVEFCGFIKLVSSTTEHKSATCVILRGVAKHSGDNAGVREGDEVVVKLMKNYDQFRKEIDMRSAGLNADSVVPVLVSSDEPELRERWRVNAEKRGYGDYPHGIVMKAAQRNVMVILLQEHLAIDPLRRMIADFARCLRLVHEKGYCHADFKPLNGVRMHNGDHRLIDLDATVQIGDPVGAKASTAYFPPEMAFVDEELIRFKNADESSVCCVASATFDLWGLGCVLYRALTRQPLFQSDDADNLISQSEARKLLDWGPTALSAALRDVEWCLDEANVPIGERLAASDL